nr:alpha/beta fold hydrolase [Sphingomonas sp. Y57]
MAQERYAYAADGTPIYFHLIGEAEKPALFLGPHFYATPTGIIDPGVWIDALADDYLVIVADYPRGVGKTPRSHGAGFSVERAVEEVERIADAAGVGAFGWLGYSFGGALGIQLGCRSGRLWALAAGGFPPLDAPLDMLTSVLSDLAENASLRGDTASECRYLSSQAFYRSLLDWDALASLSRLTVPRLAFMGTDDLAQGMSDPIEIPLAPRMKATEAPLRRLGWEIAWLEGRDHAGGIDADLTLPIVADFFKRSSTDNGFIVGKP